MPIPKLTSLTKNFKAKIRNLIHFRARRASSDTSRRDSDPSRALDIKETIKAVVLAIEESLKINPEETDAIIQGSDLRTTNPSQGTIEAMTKACVDYLNNNGITTIGIGERFHAGLATRKVMLQGGLLSELASKGFKDMVYENLLQDIPKNEWDIVDELLKKHRKDSIEASFNALKELVLSNSRLPTLKFNYESIIHDPDAFLLLIIKAYRLGVNLYGVVTQDVLRTVKTEEDLWREIKENGEAQIQDLKERGKKAIYYGGDLHVTCLPLRASKKYPNPELFTFGQNLFKNSFKNGKSQYANLSILSGTIEDISKYKAEFGYLAYNFYSNELRAIPIGKAKARVIQSEHEHRIILIYNSPSNSIEASNTRNILTAQGCTFITGEMTKESASSTPVGLTAQECGLYVENNKESASNPTATLPKPVRGIPVEKVTGTIPQGDAQAGKGEESVFSSVTPLTEGVVARIQRALRVLVKQIVETIRGSKPEKVEESVSQNRGSQGLLIFLTTGEDICN